MYWNETFSLLYEIKKVSPLKSGDLRVIRVEEQSIELTEVLGIIQGLPHAGDIIEINRIPAHCLRQDRKILVRIMMLGLVSEKKHAYRLGRSVPEKDRKYKQSKRETSHVHEGNHGIEKG